MRFLLCCFLLIALSGQSQPTAFNRSVAESNNLYSPLVYQFNDTLMLAYEDRANGFWQVLLLNDEATDTLAQRKVNLSIYGAGGGNGILQSRDGTFYLHGTYYLGCDVDLGSQSFLFHFDRQLNLLDSVKIRRNSFFDEIEFNALYELGSGRFLMAGNQGFSVLDYAAKQLLYDSIYPYRITVAPLRGDSILLYGLDSVSNVTHAAVFRYRTEQFSSVNYRPGQLYGNDPGRLGLWDQANQKLRLLNRTDLSISDSLDLSGSLSFQPRRLHLGTNELLGFQRDSLWAFYRRADLGFRGSHRTHSHFPYPTEIQNRSGILYSRATANQVWDFYYCAGKVDPGQLHLEAHELSAPPAARFSSVEVRLTNVREQVLNASASVNGYLVDLETEWEATFINRSSDTLRHLSILYSNSVPFGFCFAQYSLEEIDSLIRPGDSITRIYERRFLRLPMDSLTQAITVQMETVPVEANYRMVETTGSSINVYQPQTIGMEETMHPSPVVEVYPNPFGDGFTVLIEDAPKTYRLYDARGQITEAGVLELGTNQIDGLRQRTPGIYFLQIEGFKQPLKLLKR